MSYQCTLQLIDIGQITKQLASPRPVAGQGWIRELQRPAKKVLIIFRQPTVDKHCDVIAPSYLISR